MNGFTKLFNSIVTSSIWEEDNETRVLWITLLAMADQDGEVVAALPRLAKLANLTVNKCQQSLQKLQAPDPDSRTPDNEGRRIRVIQGGWLILNHKLYREKSRSSERKTYLRDKKREERAQKKLASTPVNNCQHSQPIAEAEAEADIKEQFMCFWEKYPNKKGKADSLKWWKRIKPDAELLQLMLAAVAAQQRERQAYAALGLWHADWPHGDVWLKHERWQDEIVMPTAAPSAIPPARNDVRVSEVR